MKLDKRNVVMHINLSSDVHVRWMDHPVHDSVDFVFTAVCAAEPGEVRITCSQRQRRRMMRVSYTVGCCEHYGWIIGNNDSSAYMRIAEHNEEWIDSRIGNCCSIVDRHNGRDDDCQ